MGIHNKYLTFLGISCMLLLVQHQAWSQKILQPNYTSVPPRIDGVIEKGEWQVTDSATQFVQMEPRAGMPASEPTTVYITFDSTTIYAALIMYHQDPSGIVGRVQNRDNMSKSDDMAGLVLDTYDDKRKAYVFYVNPLGTQSDMKVSDDGRNLDPNWDTEWESAAGRFDRGWVVEMAIPFKSIHYRSGLTSWGFNAGRIIRHNAETVYWSGKLSDDFRISQGGMLEGIMPPQRRSRVALFPYGTIRYDNPPIPGQQSFLPENSKWRPEVGLDARIGITSQLDANLTVNPDFATVEGDQEKINLTRWELSFPEKRLFFLEGNEMFNTRIKTFYSRRIGDINYGAKVSGKIGNMDMNVLTARTIEDTSRSEPAALFTTVRLKQDILKSSTIGLTIVDKSWKGGFSRSLSADYILNLGKTWKLTGQYVGSLSEGLDSPWHTRSAWFVRVAKESNIYHAHVRYSNTGENFKENVNQTGFIREDDMRELDSDLSYRWWMENKWIKYFSVSARNNVFWNHQGILRSWNLTQSARLYTQQRFSLDLSYSDEFKLYEKKYYNHRLTGKLGYNTDEWASASLAHSLGKNYERDFHLTTLSARVKPVTSLALEYSLDILDFKPDADNSSSVINILSVNYNFTRDLWLRVFAQNNSSIDRIYIYGLFGWRFKPPFGALYLIYTSDEKMVLPEPEKYRSRTFFVKLTYPIIIGN